MEGNNIDGPGNLGVSAAITPDVVVIKVGPGHRVYRLHKQLLVYHSERFRQLLTGYPHSDITLTHTYAEVFDVFVLWLYEKRLPIGINVGSCWVLTEAYVLADFLSVNHFKAVLIDRIYTVFFYTNGYLDTTGVCRLFGVLPEGDPLLRLVVDAFCVNNGIQSLDVVELARIEELPKEYLAQVLRKLHELSQLPEEDRKLRRADYIGYV